MALSNGRIELSSTEMFDRGEFRGRRYVTGETQAGFTALHIVIKGQHPPKRVPAATRVYLVLEGKGLFVIDGEEHVAIRNDLFCIVPGTPYRYEGDMTLFEFNISAENDFADEKL